MPERQTFAQHLIHRILPEGIRLEKPMDKSELNRILSEVFKKFPAQYDQVVSDLKRLGDKFSTLDGITMGMDEIAVPNKEKRDELLARYSALVDGAKTEDERLAYLGQLQKEIVENDTKDRTDDATLMVESGGLASKRNQLVKLRSTPVVVKGRDGKVLPEVFKKSYSQGQEILHHWLQSAEARQNLAQGQVSTSEPGVYNKILNNILSDVVVSQDDCGTRQGVNLFAKDDDVLDRYLAAKAGRFARNTLVTPEVQQELLKAGVTTVLVRSPQTCEAPENTVCSMCYGLSNATGKKYPVGTNAGAITAGSLAEPLVQLSLSAKHSTTMAKKEEGLTGIHGFSQYVETPKIYPNRKILCEVIGEVVNILPAPQGGKYITIRETRLVPDRYIIHALKHPQFAKHWQYYIPPRRKILEEIERGTQVYPGMELTDGVDNLQDVARLRNLGVARAMAAEGMRNIYKNTGQSLDRRHFEMLARRTHNYVRIEKAPAGFPLDRGEVVSYNKLRGAVSKLTSRPTHITAALGQTLLEPIHEFTIGTEITQQVVERLKHYGVKAVKAASNLEVSPVTVPMTQVPLLDDDWVAALNHRHLKTTLKRAAGYDLKSDIHGYKPMTSYAYGVEMGQDQQGRY